jgi:hypothetical protein
MSLSLGKIFLTLVSLTSFSDAALTLIPIADNNTFRNQPDANQSGSGVNINIKAAVSGQTNARTGFFKFDTSTASSAIDGSAAIFKVTNTTASTTLFRVRVYALNSGVSGYDWLESDSSSGAGDGITWNNSPAFSDSSATNFLDTAKVTEIGTFDITDGTAIGANFQVPLSNWSEFVQADGTLTLISVVYGQSSASPTMTLGSSEHNNAAYRPTLTFVPEPSTLMLSALGVIPLLRRKR